MIISNMYRIYPTKVQKNLMLDCFAICLELYNLLLEDRINCHKNNIKCNKHTQSAKLPQLKIDNPRFANVYSQILQETVNRVDLAFKNFFRRVKENRLKKTNKKVGFPRFKSEGNYNSMLFPQAKTGSGFRLIQGGDKIRVSKLETLR